MTVRLVHYRFNKPLSVLNKEISANCCKHQEPRIEQDNSIYLKVSDSSGLLSARTRAELLSIFMDMPVERLIKESVLLYDTYQKCLNEFLVDTVTFDYVADSLDILKDALLGRVLCGSDVRL